MVTLANRQRCRSIVMLEPQTYVLVTAAYNEEAFIGNAIRSILAQTVKPLRWVIFSDGSTDRTDEIVSACAADYPFIELIRLPDGHPRDFGAAQANAIQIGYRALQAF